jgi:hypothetical protein
VKVPDLAKYDQVIDDQRLNRLMPRLERAFGSEALNGLEFATFVQPRRRVSREEGGIEVPVWVDEMAVFAVISSNPRRPTSKLMSHGTVSLSNFRAADGEFNHYVDRPDPAFQILAAVVKDHLRKLDDLRSLLN